MSLKSQQDEKNAASLLQHPEEIQELLLRLRALEGYMSTLLQEGMQKDVAITTELEQINQVSQRLQQEIMSTLQTSTDNLKHANAHYKQTIEENITALTQMLPKIVETIEANKTSVINELQTNRNYIEGELEDIAKYNRKQLQKSEHEAKTMISSVRKQVMFYDWLDVFKYSVGSLALNVPVFALLYYVFIR